MGSRGGGLSRVKNKAPAPVQITAEQLLREVRIVWRFSFSGGGGSCLTGWGWESITNEHAEL